MVNKEVQGKRITCTVCLGDKYKKRNCKHCQGRGYLVLKDKKTEERLYEQFPVKKKYHTVSPTSKPYEENKGR